VVRWNKPSSFPQRTGVGGHAGAANTVQRARTEAVFTPQARILRPPAPADAYAEELLPGPGGGFQVRSAQRQTLSPPSGTFNFVCVHGDAPRARPVLVSTKLPHAQLAGGRPVVYAGTARFEQGAMAWWSNYSGTYQPVAAFRAQAGLPEDKFVPWQKLQMGGVSMQRGTFSERRPPGVPARAAAKDGAGTERKVGGATGTAAVSRAEKPGSGGPKS
jgi:hypothetical protein